MNPTATMEDQVRRALELIRPAIQMDGGDIELEGIEAETVTVKLYGACDGCPMSPVTLRQGVEKILSEHVPGITRVIAVEA
jgi:Fe-S cluster biogenesis protein NfuA